jgi:hypothetical protein
MILVRNTRPIQQPSRRPQGALALAFLLSFDVGAPHAQPAQDRDWGLNIEQVHVHGLAFAMQANSVLYRPQGSFRPIDGDQYLHCSRIIAAASASVSVIFDSSASSGPLQG